MIGSVHGRVYIPLYRDTLVHRTLITQCRDVTLLRLKRRLARPVVIPLASLLPPSSRCSWQDSRKRERRRYRLPEGRQYGGHTRVMEDIPVISFVVVIPAPLEGEWVKRILQ
ncbi:hypothetical protein BAUCODRAFT_39711 [Baudoinia panamericana UAMH 10762]|uniref:Uncharacterized protein n=1 Tax=Baudoinia panamericana (strain UAMH 10762) TaxID=717646 RepID=M2MI09_BAUPA|nr:uncharacterized protein BAUCODRAFT_39711 [Baudoinia panamericana UAMH 10762]EMC90898.1 hypothetical protein BAUCODRAFT_39711 [Baudoinia panamericana UAMH 10762]